MFLPVLVLPLPQWSKKGAEIVSFTLKSWYLIVHHHLGEYVLPFAKHLKQIPDVKVCLFVWSLKTYGKEPLETFLET